jgi:DNA polymerase-4
MGDLERTEQLEQLRVLEMGRRIRVLDALGDSIGVDTPEDLERVRIILLGESVRQAVFSDSNNSLGRDRPAFREHDPKGLTLGSISNENTFAADIGDLHLIRKELCSLCERVCWRVRQRNVLARTITLKLRYSDFATLTRSSTIAPTSAEVAVFGCVRKLFRANYDRQRRVRLLGVSLSNLVGRERQLVLPFVAEQRPDVSNAIDVVRDRFGYDSIHFGARMASRWRN